MSISEHLFRYSFDNENKQILLNFLKTAEEHKKNKFCNFSEHKSLSKFICLDESLERELKDYVSKQNVVIDITEDDDQDQSSSKDIIEFVNENLSIIVNANQSTVNDLIHSIKEYLETEKCISISILNTLIESDVKEIVFSLLTDILNTEEVLSFGTSLQKANIDNHFVIAYYIKYLLISKLTFEYSDQLQDILNQFSTRYPNITLEELNEVLLNIGDNCKIVLQFINGLNVEFKTCLLKKFVFNCKTFNENYIPVVETLISAHVEYNILNKLIEILSNASGSFINDKSFGKFLVKVVTLLGKNVTSVEQPLRHIIGSHKSIWKSKIQKTFDDCLQDCSFSQTFKC
ncbi:hypothetical protein NQ317_012279 [Molorchus minor]|uniref:Uncharacterized protein n=1 Tax=Molorchus minor TaxID=1323400 RepID=A0ABQ9K3Y3_9CUCU|nr:hypothetical protein NQ317_012279 [Molorchus minor]